MSNYGNTATSLDTIAREKVKVQTDDAFDAAFRQRTMRRLQAVAESTGSTAPSAGTATQVESPVITVTTQAIIDHTRARVLAERIESPSSRTFCNYGTISTGFIIDTRMHAAAGCSDMKALSAYVEARLRTENGRAIPQGW